MSIYDYDVTTIGGETISLNQYKNQVILIVNVASKCGFTKQYDGLQGLYEKYKEQGFVILGFPCNQFKAQEPGTNEEIQAFCRLNYGVTFPMFDKIHVNGENAHPLYQYLIQETDGKKIPWNFTKFLIGKDGNVVNRYHPMKRPKNLGKEIEKLLNLNYS